MWRLWHAPLRRNIWQNSRPLTAGQADSSQRQVGHGLRVIYTMDVLRVINKENRDNEQIKNDLTDKYQMKLTTMPASKNIMDIKTSDVETSGLDPKRDTCVWRHKPYIVSTYECSMLTSTRTMGAFKQQVVDVTCSEPTGSSSKWMWWTCIQATLVIETRQQQVWNNSRILLCTRHNQAI